MLRVTPFFSGNSLCRRSPAALSLFAVFLDDVAQVAVAAFLVLHHRDDGGVDLLLLGTRGGGDGEEEGDERESDARHAWIIGSCTRSCSWGVGVSGSAPAEGDGIGGDAMTHRCASPCPPASGCMLACSGGGPCV
jgi:hypothetical protein